MAQADNYSKRADGAEARLDGAYGGGRGECHRVSPVYAAAARRLPLRLVGDDSSPRTLGPAPLLSAPRRESLLLREDGQASPKKKFKDCPIGYLHVDFAEVLIEEDRQYLFVASDRTSKVAFAELHPRAKRVVAAEFL